MGSSGYRLDMAASIRRPAVDFRFERATSAARDARHALRQLKCNVALAHDLALVASELVTNVVMHTQRGGRMLAWDTDPVRLEVHDSSPLPPAVTGKQPGGRGLRIIDAVCSGWGTAIVPTGKVVWAEFDR